MRLDCVLLLLHQFVRWWKVLFQFTKLTLAEDKRRIIHFVWGFSILVSVGVQKPCFLQSRHKNEGSAQVGAAAAAMAQEEKYPTIKSKFLTYLRQRLTRSWYTFYGGTFFPRTLGHHHAHSVIPRRTNVGRIYCGAKGGWVLTFDWIMALIILSRDHFGIRSTDLLLVLLFCAVGCSIAAWMVRVNLYKGSFSDKIFLFLLFYAWKSTFICIETT